MGTKITARLNEIITDQNLIYCATVNLTWNELSEFLKGKVTFSSPCPTIDFLNQKTFTKDMLDNKCYLAYADFIKNGILNRIKKDLKEKFNETSKIDLDPNKFSPIDILAYSFLLKILTFKKKFEKLDHVFTDKTVESFGIKKVRVDIEHKLKNQVYILYYNDPDDFSISLQTETSDKIFLVKTPIIEGISIEDIIKKNEAITYQNNSNRLQTNECLMVPKIEFDLEHHFKEMIGQNIFVNNILTEYYIEDSVQFIKFLLNEEGVKLRSEMAICARKRSCVFEQKPRQFIFDKPFLIYLKEGQKAPYFAAWIANTELLKLKNS